MVYYTIDYVQNQQVVMEEGQFKTMDECLLSIANGKVYLPDQSTNTWATCVKRDSF